MCVSFTFFKDSKVRMVLCLKQLTFCWIIQWKRFLTKIIHYYCMVPNLVQQDHSNHAPTHTNTICTIYNTAWGAGEGVKQNHFVCYPLWVSDFVLTISPEPFSHFQPNLVWCFIIMMWSVIQKIWFTIFKVKITGLT